MDNFSKMSFPKKFMGTTDMDDEYKSEASMATSTRSEEFDYNDMMGNAEVALKGDPVKGKRYCIFNCVMMLALSVIVWWNSTGEGY